MKWLPFLNGMPGYCQSPFVEICGRFPKKTLFTVMREQEEVDSLNGAQLFQNIQRLGSFLQQVMENQEKAVLVFPQGLEYLQALLACFYANVIAIPAPVADTLLRDQDCDKIFHLLGDSQTNHIITTEYFKQILQANNKFNLVEILAIDESFKADFPLQDARLITPEDIALLLYSSGSTAHAKGVVLSHANVLYQAFNGARQWRIKKHSQIVSWMPQFHNFGLHFNFLAPLLKGAASIILAPSSFISQPAAWFRILDQYSATHTAAPNFAFDYCCSSLEDRSLDNISLHHLQAIICGGEPIRKETYEIFIRHFQRLGLRKNVFCPHYGLSEVGSVTTKKPNKPIKYLFLDIPSLKRGIIQIAADKTKSKTIVGCGEIDPALIEVIIANPDTGELCADNQAGEIWVRSAAIGQGYYNRAEDSQRSFKGVLKPQGENGFLRTGDIGFIADKELYIVGREKEVIIIHGKNHYPVDFEWTIKKHIPGLTLPIAVFSQEFEQQEKVIVVQELDETISAEDWPNIVKTMIGAVAENHGVELYEINLVKLGSIPRSGTGKILKKACKTRYLEDDLPVLYRYRQGEPQTACEPAAASTTVVEGVLGRLKTEAFLPILKIAPQRLEQITAFWELGLDSIQYVRLAQNIETVFNIQFPPALLFKYRDFTQLAEYIASQIKYTPPLISPRHSVPNSSALNQSQDIAIIGMSCHFPGGASDLYRYWDNLLQGKDGITALPDSRPQILHDYQTQYGKLDEGFPPWGGFIANVAAFDAAFFGISPLEAESMDPQQRKLLELVWQVIEDSAYQASQLAGQNIGLFLGVHNNDYAELVARQPELLPVYGAYLDSGLHMSMLANRISRWFDFRGPSEVVNTACSSSLVAIQHAVESIRRGESCLAIAGGINLILGYRVYRASHKAGMLAQDGRCKTFDARADGFVRAEGYGAVLLKPLHLAERDGDIIYGIIKRAVVNHDGKSNSLRAPNLEAQKALLKAAYQDPALPPASIGYIETHGTGTVLGDPIEFAALQEAFLDIDPGLTHGKCGLGTVKTNIGHCESAAGIAGLIKTVLAVRQGILPGILHFEKTNPYIQLESSPFYIVDQRRDWPRNVDAQGRPLPRRAGISSFGFGGVNAHVVVEEYLPQTEPDAAPSVPVLIAPLSARDGTALQARVAQLHGFLTAAAARGEPIDPARLAYTLQVGREAMPERLALVARDIDDLTGQLAALCQEAGEPTPGGRARVKDRQAVLTTLAPGQSAAELLRTCLQAGDYPRLAQYWVQGGTVDWAELYGAGKPQRMALPTYPFAPQHYWIPEAPPIANSATLHPLLHRNTSDFAEQRYRSSFTGEEFFLRDHQVQGLRVLPGVAHLEMARAAVIEAAGIEASRNGLSLTQIVWSRPVTVEAPGTTVHIGLYPETGGVIGYHIWCGDDRQRPASQGKIRLGQPPASLRLDLDRIRADCTLDTLSPETCYARFADLGIAYGPAHRAIAAIHRGTDQVLARLALPDGLTESHAQFGLHPSLMDAALQASLMLTPDEPLALPFALQELAVFGPCSPEMWAYIRLAQADGSSRKFDIELCDGQGQVAIRMQGFSTRRLAGRLSSGVNPSGAAGITHLLAPRWRVLSPASTGPAPEPSERVAVMGGDAAGLQAIRHYWPTAPAVATWEDIAELLAGSRLWDHLIWLAPRTDSTAWTPAALVERQETGVIGLFRLLKALLHAGYGKHALNLTVLTWQAQAVRDLEPVAPDQAAVHGLIGSLAKEYPLWKIRLVDVPEGLAWPVAELFALPPDPQGLAWAYRAGAWYRQVMQPVQAESAGLPPYRQGGVYVVIGGAGGLGEVWSESLIRDYQARVIWIGRRDQDAAIQAKLDRLATLGPAPEYFKADASDRTALAAAYAEIKTRHPTVHGLVHSALALLDQSLAKMDEARFRAGLSAKLATSVWMSEVFRPEPLDFILFFSSVIAFTKAAGQSNYAAGCAFVDAYAHALARQVACPVKVMNWGYWGQVGAVASETYRTRMAEAGIGSLEPPEGLAALATLLAGPWPQLALIKTTQPSGLAGFPPIAESAAEPAAIAIDPLNPPASAPSLAQDSPMHSVASTPAPAERRDVQPPALEEHIKQTIREKLAVALRADINAIYTDEAFADYGLDSITGVHLVQVLNDTLQIELETTSLFDHSSINHLTQHILSRFGDTLLAQHGYSPEPVPVAPLDTDTRDDPPNRYRSYQPVVEPAQDHPPRPAQAVQPDAIAIIGMSGRFAKAQNLAELWRYLQDGTDLVGTVQRWNLADYYPDGQDYCHHGGFLDGIDQFDPLFFNISGIEASHMDPQQRIFLEEAWTALEDAGYAGSSVEGRKCGVYVGCGPSDYPELFANNPPAQAFWGNASSVTPARIAYHLDLQGPAVTVDTACSSSLVAVHLACQGLRMGETELAIAGGVFIQCTPRFYLNAQRAAMLSPTGRCQAFDHRADGFVPGEGVGVVVLKRLQDALAAGDHIYGVILGSGINQDGSTNGITAPSALSQERLERQVYDSFGIDPGSLQMVEAHGTGTKLGDPIEFQALSRAFGSGTNTGYCALGSIKTNIGHTATAAGVAGLLKILLSLQHRAIPPSLHFQAGNPNIRFQDSPFYVNTRLRDWESPAQGRRRAALSSFGFSGTNAHLVIEEAPGGVPPSPRKPASLVVLSARSAAQLAQQVRQLLDYCRQHPDSDCGHISHTLLLGRKHLNHRLACVVPHTRELAEQLSLWLERGQAPQIFAAEVPEQAAREQPALKRYGNVCLRKCATLADPQEFLEDLAMIAELYIQGYALDYGRLFEGGGYARLSLPTYPFARKSYWVSDQSRQPPTPRSQRHPLLHENTSDFSGQRYSSTFTGREFFLADHVVHGQRLLPGVAYLEMARAAVMNATGQSSGLRLTNLVWLQPLAVTTRPVQVHIRLRPPSAGRIDYEIYTEAQDASPSIHHQGSAVLQTLSPVPSLDSAALRARCHTALSPAECYAAFKTMGIAFGPAQQGLTQVFAGPGLVLAKLVLPAVVGDSLGQFGLHPSLMDAVLQAALALDGNIRSQPWLLFAVEEIAIHGHCTATMWASLRRRDTPAATPMLDIDVYDEQGMARVCIRGAALRAGTGTPQPQPSPASAPEPHRDGVGTLSLVPCWEVRPLEVSPTLPHTTVAVIGGNTQTLSALQAAGVNLIPIQLEPDAALDAITQVLQAHSRLEHWLWIAPHGIYPAATDDALLTAQRQAIYPFFRFIKALLACGYGDRPLDLGVITTAAVPVRAKDIINAAQAPIHGLIGALAKEYPRWQIRLADLPAASPRPLLELFRLPPDPQGQAWALRDGEWYRQNLVPVQAAAAGPTPYRQGGVYVVIGGAGSLGEVWSEPLIRDYQARIIWIGRRRKDAAIQAKLDRLATLGPAPEYLVADASDRAALHAAYTEIKSRYPVIHGVIHSAMVMAGRSLAALDEATLAKVLTPKIDISLRIAQVFQAEPLDFLVFFSSINAFLQAAGQGNYAAGCTFIEAYAQQLAQHWPHPVKLMNWGYWGGMGRLGASPDFQAWMAENGVGSLEPSEGMAALATLLTRPLRQLALLKTTRPTGLEGLQPAAEQIEFAPPAPDISATVPPCQPDEPAAALIRQDLAALEQAFEALLCRLLLVQLRTLDLFEDAPVRPESLARRLTEPYPRWLTQSLAFLVEHGRVVQDGRGYALTDPRPDPAWQDWEQERARWLNHPDFQAQATLVEATLRALPDILAGRIPATQVLFPQGSMSRVQGIYQGHRIADYFNDRLAETLRACLETRLRLDPAAQCRLLEIGAGTGGTTARVLPLLDPHRAHLREYAYTDLSQAFLRHGEEQYGAGRPYLACRIFDVETSPVAQGFTPGSYDFVLATNVLHATRDLRQTLRNAKALLKRHGLLLVNEISQNSLFAHLTFGLLDGWWRYRDAALRLPGCPGVAPGTWRRLLESEGFRTVRFPAEAAHSLGQQIILAESDGVIRQPQPQPNLPHRSRPPAAPAPRVTVSMPPVDDPGATERRLATEIRQVIVEQLSTSLHVEREAIDPGASFADFGVDSLLAVQVTRGINQALGIELETTRLFDHSSVQQLTAYILSRFQTVLATKQGAHSLPSNDTAIQSLPPARPVDTGLRAQQREEHIRRAIVGQLSAALQLEPTAIDPNASFADFGVDSLLAVQIARSINQALAIELETTRLFDHSSVKHLTTYILSRFPQAVTPEPQDIPVVSAPPDPIPAAPQDQEPAAQTLREPIAIIGMSGRFPQSPDLSTLWTHLANGDDLIENVSRWDLSPYFAAGESYCRQGGFLADIDKFDPLFFRISGSEAVYMDPQQRLFLEEAWKALEDAGYAGSAGEGRNCGVYVGYNLGDYRQLIDTNPPPQMLLGNASSVIPARIAYYLNLQGPAITIDTACSSALVAVHLACQGLWAGETELALAGGVFVQCTPAFYLATSRTGMLSATGRCHTFDAAADGFVPGEGVGVVVLKRLRDALADGDSIHGVIRGSGINQDGTTNGLSAPSAVSQERLECQVYQRFGIDPGQIQMVEAHGTGTTLGDPIEFQALTGAFRQYTARQGYCALGSIKTNLGHAASAAGMAGLLKVLLSLKHRQIPPSLHFQQGNPHIQFQDSPFYVNTRLRDWVAEPGASRRAAISSFGFSGTNAHLVIEEAPAPRRQPVTRPAYLIVLSARTLEQLRQQARQLVDYGQREPDTHCGHISHTLLLGRKHCAHRLACVVNSTGDLIRTLDYWLTQNSHPQLWVGEVRESERREQHSLKQYGNDCLAKLASADNYSELLATIAELYIQGYALDYGKLFQGGGYARISLPTYPFADERYWVESPHIKPPPLSPAIPQGLTPPPEGLIFLPVWETQPAISPTIPKSQHVLLVNAGPDTTLEQALLAYYHRLSVPVILLRLGNQTRQVSAQQWLYDIGDAESYKPCLETYPPFDTLYFLANDGNGIDTLDTALASPLDNELSLLRLIQSLKQQDKIAHHIDTYLITRDTQRLAYAPVQAYGGGITGLGYSLAQGEHRFQVRNLDISRTDLINPAQTSILVQQILGEPASDRGEVIKLNAGRRYRQLFLKLDPSRFQAAPPFRTGGVYLIAGGSGTIGTVITRYLIQEYQAQIIWLGRRPAQALQEKLTSFRSLGHIPWYLQADVTDAQALTQAVAAIKQRYPVLHGAIFSGLVFKTDNPLAHTQEREFLDILEVKTQGSLNFYAALQDEPLDFLCYFSSSQAFAFSGAAHFSAYATGISYADTLVRHLQDNARFPVGIINWGFWETSMQSAPEDTFIGKNIGAVADEEGYRCFAWLVALLRANQVSQAACLRVSPAVMALIHTRTGETITLSQDTAYPLISQLCQDQAADSDTLEKLRASSQREDMRHSVAKVLFQQLRSLGILQSGELPERITTLRDKARIDSRYTRWFEESLAILATQGYVSIENSHVHVRADQAIEDSTTCWREWQAIGKHNQHDPEWKTLFRLLDACLKNLPDILQGHIPATDVLFPNASMSMVEDIYRETPRSKYFNTLLAAAVEDYVRLSLAQDPHRSIRIIEAGAGTGGTSATVLARLQPYLAHIHYCYTDISRSFLLFGQERYGRDYPCLEFKLWNVESPVADQDITAGSYDVVIATNVLHATRNIRQTLRHLKAVLRNQGILLLNEVTEKTPFLTLTYGLLEGWWLAEDTETRIPGSPLLDPETWQAVLGEEGFRYSRVLAAVDVGQQVIAAESDGLIRSVNPVESIPSPSQTVPMPLTIPMIQNQPVPQQETYHTQGLEDRLKSLIVEYLSQSLRIAKAHIQTSVGFADYGVDSIIGVAFVNTLNQELGIQLNSAILFDYTTIDRLAGYILGSYKAQLEQRLVQPNPSSASIGHKAPDIPTDGLSMDTGILTELERRFWANEVSTDELVEALARCRN